MLTMFGPSKLSKVESGNDLHDPSVSKAGEGGESETNNRGGKCTDIGGHAQERTVQPKQTR